MIQFRNLGASPFTVDAFVAGDAKRVNLVVLDEKGQVVKRVRMKMRRIDPASYAHGLPREVSKWSGNWKPKKVGRYEFFVEIPETDERSENGVLVAVEEGANQNPMSNRYGIAATWTLTYGLTRWLHDRWGFFPEAVTDEELREVAELEVAPALETAATFLLGALLWKFFSVRFHFESVLAVLLAGLLANTVFALLHWKWVVYVHAVRPTTSSTA